MENLAQIKVSHHEICRGRYYETYEWLGKKTDQIFIHGEDNYNLKNLPWKFVEIKTDIWKNGIYYMRKDAMLPIGWLIWLFVRLSNFWNGFSAKMIMTLNVWGLAYTDVGCIPSWKDIGKKSYISTR